MQHYEFMSLELSLTEDLRPSPHWSRGPKCHSLCLRDTQRVYGEAGLQSSLVEAGSF